MVEAAKSCVAIIAARGGSKGLPRKNLLPLAGKPLICHTIEAALACPAIEDVYVSTEDAEIRDVSLKAGAGIVPRPLALAQDDLTSRDVVLHALDWLEANGRRHDSFALLQPTSPLRTSAHIEGCIAAFRGGDYGCAVSVCEADHHPSKMLVLGGDGCVTPWGASDDLNVPRQKLRKAYRQNGAIYLMGIEDFRKRTGNFFLDPALGYVMTQEDSVDIDTPLDLRIAELLLGARK